jgi:hypothetical protein
MTDNNPMLVTPMQWPTVDQLESELLDLISSENYEAASVMRDRIATLKNQPIQTLYFMILPEQNRDITPPIEL